MPNNGFNPTWNEEASFTIRVPELAILEFRVSDLIIIMSMIIMIMINDYDDVIDEDDSTSCDKSCPKLCLLIRNDLVNNKLFS